MTTARDLRLITLFTVVVAAILAATGRVAAALALIGLLLLFSAVVVWRDRRFSDPPAQPKEGEAWTRRLISRALPCLLILFLAILVYDLIDGDWFRAGCAGVFSAAAVVGMYLNRRRLSEIEAR